MNEKQLGVYNRHYLIHVSILLCSSTKFFEDQADHLLA